MNKKLIAIAVAGAIAPMAAVHAETTPYAQIQFEVANIDDGSTSEVTVTDRERGRIGLKGSEDIGNGMQAIGIAEFDFVGGNKDSEFGDGTDSNGDTFRGNALRVREIMAGIKGGFGEIQIGTLKSAYKYSGGVKYDPFVTTTLEARGNYGMTAKTSGQNGFINNALAYKNKFGALGVWATYSPDQTDRDGDGTKDGGEYTLAVSFNAGALEAFGARYDSGLSDSTKQYSSNKIGAKFKLGSGMAIMGQYEKGDKAGTDLKTMFIGFHLGLGKNTIVLQAGNTKLDDGVDDANDGSYMAVGAIHKFSKKARVFVGYKKSKGKDSPATEETVTSIGLRVAI